MNPRIASVIFIFTIIWQISLGADVKIRGKVTDEKNEPMEFATIRISGTALGTATGPDGSFALTAPYADTIKVIFSAVGYDQSRRTLVQPAEEVILNVKMTPKNLQLQEVQVTDFRKQTDNMQTVGTGSLKTSPDASGSVEALIQTLAGVTSGNELSSQYSVRGGSYDENSVYINGIEVYRPQLVTSGQQEGLSVINPDLTGNISFSTGGFPAVYSDKMSSVLSITYREPSSFEGSASASLMGGSLALGSRTGILTMLHGVRYKSTSSLLSSLDEKGEYDPRYFDYQTSITLRPSSKWVINFLGNAAINTYLFQPRNRTTSFGTVTDAKKFTVYFDGKEKDRFETFFGAMSLSYIPSKKSFYTLTASGFLTNELVTYDISGEYWLDEAGSGEIGGELGVGRYHEHARNRLKASVMSIGLRGHTGINHHNLTYGVEGRIDHITERSREWELRDSAGYSLPSSPDALKVIYSLTSRQNLSTSRFTAYVQDGWRMATESGLFTLNAGVRMTYRDINREFLVSPRISAGFIPEKHPQWTFRLSTGLYYQAPFFKEMRMAQTDEAGNTVIVLNKDVKSPRSLQFIAGTDYTFRAFGRSFKLTGEIYYKALSNLIPYEIDNLKVVYSGINAGKGHAMGADFKLFGQFVPGSDSWISFSLMNTSENIGGIKAPLPSDRRYSAAIFFTDYFPGIPRLKFSLRGIFSDGLPMTAPHSTREQGYFRAPAYKRADIGVAYELISPPVYGKSRSGMAKYLRSVELGLDVFNLFDMANVSSYYWVTDVNDIRYAVPNYLTLRQINVRLAVTF